MLLGQAGEARRLVDHPATEPRLAGGSGRRRVEVANLPPSQEVSDPLLCSAAPPSVGQLRPTTTHSLAGGGGSRKATEPDRQVQCAVSGHGEWMRPWGWEPPLMAGSRQRRRDHTQTCDAFTLQCSLGVVVAHWASVVCSKFSSRTPRSWLCLRRIGHARHNSRASCDHRLWAWLRRSPRGSPAHGSPPRPQGGGVSHRFIPTIEAAASCIPTPS